MTDIAQTPLAKGHLSDLGEFILDRQCISKRLVVHLGVTNKYFGSFSLSKQIPIVIFHNNHIKFGKL